MSYRYYAAPGGYEFAYASAPTFLCPHSDFAWVDEDADPADREWIPSEAARAVAVALGTTDQDACRMLRRAHASHSHRRRRVDDKLTDRCDACGAKMRRKGFRAWAQRPRQNDGGTGQRIAERLGMSPPAEVVESVYVETKREARAWAYAKHEEHKARASS